MFTEIGGLIKIFQVGVNILVFPIQEFLYMLVLISHLYIAKTK